MNRYFFILGKNPILSLAEINAVLVHQKINYSPINYSQEVLIIDSLKELDVNSLIKTLGGTIKIGRIMDEVGFDEDEVKFNQVFSAENLLKNYFPRTLRKLHFGISVYNAGGNHQHVAQLERRIKDFNLTIKNNLQEKGIRSGFLRIKERFLSSVSVFKNKLLTEGAEIVFVSTQDNLMFGKTLAVQEFASFSFRDYSRPARDKRSGIMPPKLARIMINLSQIEKDAVMLDPFCGSGTILQEAIILGYNNIIGADISHKAISDTKKNIDWLFKQYPSFKIQNYNLKIICQDVNIISKQLSPQTVDAVVTEPYLGPPLYQKPDIRMMENILSETGSLYLAAFRELRKALKPKGKIVIVFPAFTDNKGLRLVEIINEIEKMGFVKSDLISSSLLNNPNISMTARQTLIYGDKEHFVQREILIFRKI